jgi:molybdopterin/thiamine biosynthesis adenylyltransferase
VLQIAVEVPSRFTGGDAVSLIATFPDLYPQFRPRISAPDLVPLAHHHDPFGFDLCLVARGSTNWANDDSLAWLITERLPIALRDATERDLSQAEPYSAYFTYVSNAIVMIETDRLPPKPETQGVLSAMLPKAAVAAGTPWIAAVSGFRWVGGEVDGSSAIEGFGEVSVEGPWVRFDEAPSTADAAQLWTLVHDAFSGPVPNAVRVSPDRYIQVAALMFPEEQSFDAMGDALMFLVKDSDLRTRRERRDTAHGPMRVATTSLVRASRVGFVDLVARDPELTSLARNHVVVIGCGAIGSVVVDTLARAGVGKLSLIDGDLLDAGNLLRHAGIVSDVGLGKAASMALHAKRVHPGIDASPYDIRIGRTGRVGEATFQREFPMNLLSEADVVIDATAEAAVHETIGELCRDLEKSLVVAEATHGAWGGTVGVFPASADTCWNCVELSLRDGLISPPQADEAGLVQPPGCAEPTFTGAGFDLSEVALQAARASIAEVTSPSAVSVLHTVELRDSTGLRIAPSWRTEWPERHIECGWSH